MSGFKNLSSTYLCQGVSRVMAEPADVVAGVVEVVGVASERSIVTQVFAVLLVVDGLPHGVHSLQDFSLDLQTKNDQLKIHTF